MARGWSPERGAVIRCLPCSLSCPRCGPVCRLLSRPPLHTGVTLLPLGRDQALTGPQLSAVYRAGLGWEVRDRRQGAQEAGDKEEGPETGAFFQNLNNLMGKKECDWHCGGVTRTSSITGSQSVMSGFPWWLRCQRIGLLCRFLGWTEPLEEETAIHSSILA